MEFNSCMLCFANTERGFGNIWQRLSLRPSPLLQIPPRYFDRFFLQWLNNNTFISKMGNMSTQEFYSTGVCPGDVCVCHEDHRPGDLLRCQVNSVFQYFSPSISSGLILPIWIASVWLTVGLWSSPWRMGSRSFPTLDDTSTGPSMWSLWCATWQRWRRRGSAPSLRPRCWSLPGGCCWSFPPPTYVTVGFFKSFKQHLV